MAKQKKVLRVVLPVTEERERGELVLWITEILRYAGLLRVHRRAGDGSRPMVFDMVPPHGVLVDVWLQHNHDRMRSFGINVVIAPEYYDG